MLLIAINHEDRCHIEHNSTEHLGRGHAVICDWMSLIFFSFYWFASLLISGLVTITIAHSC